MYSVIKGETTFWSITTVEILIQKATMHFGSYSIAIRLSGRSFTVIRDSLCQGIIKLPESAPERTIDQQTNNVAGEFIVTLTELSHDARNCASKKQLIIQHTEVSILVLPKLFYCLKTF